MLQIPGSAGFSNVWRSSVSTESSFFQALSFPGWQPEYTVSALDPKPMCFTGLIQRISKEGFQFGSCQLELLIMKSNITPCKKIYKKNIIMEHKTLTQCAMHSQQWFVIRDAYMNTAQLCPLFVYRQSPFQSLASPTGRKISWVAIGLDGLLI